MISLIDEEQNALQEAFDRLSAAWPAACAEVANILLNSGALSKAKYKTESVSALLHEMDAYLDAGMLFPLFKGFEKFTVSSISGAVKKNCTPSFASIAANNRLASATNTMVASLHLARSEAIKRNSRVVLCTSATGTSCTASGDWQQGWLVLHDVNNNATLDAGEVVLLKQQGMPEGLRLTGNSWISRYISYVPTGATRTVSGVYQFWTLTVCDGESLDSVRLIKISSTGRLRTTKVSLASCP